MTWLRLNYVLVVELAVAHLLLVAVSMTAAVLISVPLGRLAWRWRRLRAPVLAGAGLLYAIPSLPLLIIIPVLFGTPLRSSSTMIIALTIYAVAVLVRSVADAFAAVPPTTRDAATAVGFARSSQLWRVDLPLAAPVIVAGIRVTTASTVSLVTVGALTGIRSLGTLFTDGFQRGIQAEVVTGVVTTIALALLLDAVIVLGARSFMPWTRMDGGRGHRRAEATGTR